MDRCARSTTTRTATLPRKRRRARMPTCAISSKTCAATPGARRPGASDEEYTETKFLRVRRIIERFRGREGSAETDKRWTRKVTRRAYWFVFSAVEGWREDDREHEHHTDAGGKSGGQKEKLAYTVLAASLAYQFGLEWGRRDRVRSASRSSMRPSGAVPTNRPAMDCAVPAHEFVTAHRHAPAEDPSHRALRGRTGPRP
jgi:hypothetical protein